MILVNWMILMHLFFFWFRCLEMLLQVQWQRNFLTCCSLLLKCHDWWWLKSDGEHRISPQVLHGAGGWPFPHLCILIFASVRILWAAIHSNCAGSEMEFLARKTCCLLFLWTERLRRRKRWDVFLPGLWRKLSSTKFQQMRERGVSWVAWPARRRRPRTWMWTAAVSCLRCLLVVCCVTWRC